MLGRKKKTITLNNGATMPLVGYGTYLTSPRQTEHLVRMALEVGYRHIDTAQNYGNEHEVGLAVKHSGLEREEVFITSKTQTTGYQATKKGIIQSLKAFDIEYIDLMIIHWPNSDNEGTYRALVEAYRSGIIRAIGVSNFNAHQIDALIKRFDIKPTVDQIETHVLWQQKRMHQYLTEQGIAHESWSPFGEGMDDIFRNETLMKIGLAHGKSAAQVILRFLNQQDIIIIPKSTKQERMKENLDIFDFTLTLDEMKLIANMDKRKSYSGWPASMQE